MPEFIFAYHGGKMPETDEQKEIVMGRWRDWMEKHKTALVNPGNPVGLSKTVSADGVEDHGGANPLSGYSIVAADDIDGAIAIAKESPHMDGGTIEVAPIIEM